MARPDSNYVLILVVPLLLIVRLFFMKTLHVNEPLDDNAKHFLNASSVFQSLRGVRNDTTNDRVVIRLRTKYRRMRRPFPILIFEQRWKKTDGQIFLVMGPKFYWISGGSIFCPAHWICGRNRDLVLTKTKINGNRTKYCINLRSSTGLEWTLRFKDDGRRNAVFQALNIIRTIEKSQQDRGASSTQNNFSSKHRLNQSSLNGTKNGWHDVLCVPPEASVFAIAPSKFFPPNNGISDLITYQADIIREHFCDPDRARAFEATSIGNPIEMNKIILWPLRARLPTEIAPLLRTHRNGASW
jgi:hypothetical protein